MKTLGTSNFSVSVSFCSAGKGQSLYASTAYENGGVIDDPHTGERHDYTNRNDQPMAAGVFATSKATAELTSLVGMGSAADMRPSIQSMAEAITAPEYEDGNLLRKDAQFASRMRMSLRHELNLEEQQNLIREFAHSYLRDRVGFWNIHPAPKDGDPRNVHVHITTSTREIGWKDFAIKAEDGEVYQLSKVAGVGAAVLRDLFANSTHHLYRDKFDSFEVQKGKRRASGKASRVKEEVKAMFDEILAKDPNNFDATEFKKRLKKSGYVLGNLGKRGFGLKKREWNTREELYRMRAGWAKLQSVYLLKAAARQENSGEAARLRKEAELAEHAHLTLSEQYKKAQERGDREYAAALEDKTPTRYNHRRKYKRERKRAETHRHLDQQKISVTVLSEKDRAKIVRGRVERQFEAGAKKIVTPRPYLLGTKKQARSKNPITKEPIPLQSSSNRWWWIKPKKDPKV